ncbi:zinc ribbon-containing protein [Clostridium baratii]
MSISGDKPGIGVYLCTNCGKKVFLTNEDILTPCKNCKGIVYRP